MAKVSIGATSLRVQLSGGEAFWGLHGSLDIHATHIIGAQALEPRWWLGLGMRLPGTAIPGLCILGTYKRRGENAYVSWVRGQQPLQINLRNHRYTRIIVGVTDAAALAEEINATITGC